MKVSIIVPVYNAEKYIADCFYSITDQTYKNIEVIFVDDCSTDNSVKILQELIKLQKDSEIYYKIFKHEVNKQDCAARNTGIKESTGDYIFFIDSDDIIPPICIEYLLNMMKKYPNAEIIKAARSAYEEEIFDKLFPSRFWGDKLLLDTIWNIIYKSIKEKETEEVLNKGGIINFWLSHCHPSNNLHGNISMPVSWATLYKKSFIKTNNIYFPEDLPNVGDLYFTYLCFKNATQVVLEHMVVYFWRMRNNSISRAEYMQIPRIEWMLELLERVLPDVDFLGDELAKWIVNWTNGLLQILQPLKLTQTEKYEILTKKYSDILKKIDEKNAQNQN